MQIQVENRLLRYQSIRKGGIWTLRMEVRTGHCSVRIMKQMKIANVRHHERAPQQNNTQRKPWCKLWSLFRQAKESTQGTDINNPIYGLRQILDQYAVFRHCRYHLYDTDIPSLHSSVSGEEGFHA